MSRYKGLTGPQRESLRLGLRPDTIIAGDQNYPARPSDVTVPGSGTDVQWWMDASQYGAAFDAADDVVTYNGSGIHFDNGEGMELMQGIISRNGKYFSLLHGGGSYTLGLRFRMDEG